MIEFLAKFAMKGFANQETVSKLGAESFTEEERYILTKLNLLEKRKDIPYQEITLSEA